MKVKALQFFASLTLSVKSEDEVVASKTKVEQTFSSSGFSGYIRVRPPEPKKDYDCKNGGETRVPDQNDQKRKSA